jgi:Flp pilus assembly protein TadD
MGAFAKPNQNSKDESQAQHAPILDSNSNDLNNPLILRQIGSQYLEKGETQQAIHLFARLVEQTPQDATAHTLLGVSLAQHGLMDDAASELQRAIGMQPGNPHARYEFGALRLREEKFDEAICSLQAAISLNPKFIQAYCSLAIAYRAMGRLSDSELLLKQAAKLDPTLISTLKNLADTFCAMGKYPEAVVLLKHVVRIDRGAANLNQLAIAQIHDARLCDAIESANQALAAEPENTTSHVLLAVANKRLANFEEALGACEQAIRLHQAKPTQWQPPFDREVAELALFLEQRSHRRTDHLAIRASTTSVESASKLITVLIGCYGDFPNYSIRAMESVASGQNLEKYCNVLIGLNDCCRQTADCARQLADKGRVNGLVESKENLNKDPMLRLLLELTRTPYVLWIDDDTHFIDDQWPIVFHDFVRNEHPFDVAGQFAKWGPRRDLDEPYMKFIRARPWWRGNAHHTGDFRDWVPFVRGGLFLARCDFLRLHNFPDRRMIQAMDDVALGELIHQVGGRLLRLSPTILSHARIGDGFNFDL